MTFDNTGRVHHEGVQNEIDSIAILQKHGILNENAKQVGGTKAKEDISDGVTDVSMKLKSKGLPVGSFDWINTSNVRDVIGDVFDEFLTNVKTYRNLPVEQKSSASFIAKVRKEFAAISCSVLNDFTSEYLKNFIKTYLIEANKGILIGIKDPIARKMYIFNSEEHPAVGFLNNGYEPFLKGKASGSRRLLFTGGTKEYDCGLRIRVTNNNGINAFLGLSKANKNSQVVFKLQQDKVHKLVESVNARILEF